MVKMAELKNEVKESDIKSKLKCQKFELDLDCSTLTEENADKSPEFNPCLFWTWDKNKDMG